MIESVFHITLEYIGVQRGYYKYIPRFLTDTIGEVKLYMINTFYRPQSQNLNGKKNAPITTWRPGFRLQSENCRDCHLLSRLKLVSRDEIRELMVIDKSYK